ncbi:MAG: bacteriohemerythrin [Magnetococcus sp. YQC-9]
MTSKIETTEWTIWGGFSAVVVLLGWQFGLSVGLAACLAIPFVIMLKNDFLRRKHGWKNAYSVGVAAMDDDHKKLLDMVWTVYHSLQKSYGKEDAERVLGELQNYTVEHFTREEALMKKHRYPELERHCAEHEAMKAKVAEFRANFSSNSLDVSREMLRFLENWLINHITKTDQAYSAFLVEKGEH